MLASHIFHKSILSKKCSKGFFFTFFLYRLNSKWKNYLKLYDSTKPAYFLNPVLIKKINEKRQILWAYERFFHQTIDFFLGENGKFVKQRPQNIFSGIYLLSAGHLKCFNFCGRGWGGGQTSGCAWGRLNPWKTGGRIVRRN